MYRWDDKYRVHDSIFGKAPAGKVKEQLGKFVKDHGIDLHSLMRTEVVTIKRPAPDRGVKVESSFESPVTMAGRHGDTDSLAGSQSLDGKWYLRRNFFGQSNDGYFRLAYQGKLNCIVDRVKRLEKKHAVLESGQELPCDLFVVASGYKYNLQPTFLKELNLGFNDLHAFAFLGKNPRIGTASDFAVLEPTSLPDHTDTNMRGGRMSGAYTWFQTRSPWSTFNVSIEERCRLYVNVLSVGRSFLGKQAIRAKFPMY
ncbi:hypothetical protein QBZ16_004045 [Prototheca wickerhamii]|uniref:Uncharacterized protein n=1 Tax=Prototheca wickerhamii TaxID=3111 RepID=A0AAD9ILI0_PROWI|nr:hypothetical protein QBZ16_004045 [Prototheca wickerhamii]